MPEERKTYILTHDSDGEKLYEEHVLQITPAHAERLRSQGMTVEEGGIDGELES